MIEKVIGDLHRRVEHAARIVAQVDDEALEFSAARVLEFGHGLFQFGGGGVGEGGDAQVTVVGRQQLGGHALQLHVGALHLELEQRRGTLAPHAQPDRAAFRSAHARDRRIQIGRVDRHAVDPDNDVAGADAGTLGRGAGHASHDTHAALARYHLDADTGVGAAGADLHVVEFIRGQEGRMIVQRFDHAANGVLH